jgi:hypothetical protein
MEVEKWVRNVVFATHAILGGVRRQKKDRSVMEARSSKTRGRKRPNTSRKGFKPRTRGKGRLWRRESVLCPREPARQGRRSVGRVWGRDGVGGGDVKKGRAKCPHHRQRNKCKSCGGSSICEHNRI